MQNFEFGVRYPGAMLFPAMNVRICHPHSVFCLMVSFLFYNPITSHCRVPHCITALSISFLSITYHLCPSHCIQFHSIPDHYNPSHPIRSHPIPFLPIPSYSSFLHPFPSCASPFILTLFHSRQRDWIRKHNDEWKDYRADSQERAFQSLSSHLIM